MSIAVVRPCNGISTSGRENTNWVFAFFALEDAKFCVILDFVLFDLKLRGDLPLRVFLRESLICIMELIDGLYSGGLFQSHFDEKHRCQTNLPELFK